jgi:hypothetical protein
MSRNAPWILWQPRPDTPQCNDLQFQQLRANPNFMHEYFPGFRVYVPFLCVKFPRVAGVRFAAENRLFKFIVGPGPFVFELLTRMYINVAAASINSARLAMRIAASYSDKNSALDFAGFVGRSSSTCDVDRAGSPDREASVEPERLPAWRGTPPASMMRRC